MRSIIEDDCSIIVTDTAQTELQIDLGDPSTKSLVLYIKYEGDQYRSIILRENEAETVRDFLNKHYPVGR